MIVKTRWLIFGVAFAWVFGGLASVQAAEFSADVTHTQAGEKAMTGKVFVKGMKIRNEIDSPQGKHVSIVDADGKKAYTLMPEQKMYMEMPLTGAMASMAQKEEEMDKFAEKKALGTEKVEGFVCDKILYTYRDKRLGSTTQWFSKELSYPLKMLHEGPQGKMTVEYKNIKKGGVSDALFTVPPDYRKMTMPGMGGGQGMPQQGTGAVGDDDDDEETPAPKGKTPGKKR